MFDLDAVARLARLHITPDERSQLQGQLAAIVTYIERLGRADTSTVAGYGLSEAPTVFRDDEPTAGSDPTERLRPASQVRDGMFVVPKVIGTGEA